jgi:hypothetical protein
MSVIRFPKISLTAWTISSISAKGRRAISPLSQPKRKSEWCDILAVWWIRGSLKSELRHLLQIGLGIVMLGIVHMGQCE